MNKTPPRYPLRFFRWFCDPDVVEDIEGDLLERFEQRTNENKAARWLLTMDVLRLFRPGIIRKFEGHYKFNYYGMIKHYFKTSLRSLLKQRNVTITSAFCLIVGVLGFQLIYTWIDNELSTNSFHTELENIYAATVTANPMAKPECTGFTTYFKFDYSSYPSIRNNLLIHTYEPGELKIKVLDKEYTGKTLVVDSTFSNFFHFPLINGTNPDLTNKKNVFITESFANKVYGSTDPVGELIELSGDNSGSYQIVGVLRKIPSNSSISFDVIVPRHSQQFWGRSPEEFFLMTPNFDKAELENQIAELGRSHIQFGESTLSLTPLEEIYFEAPVRLYIYNKYGNSDYLIILCVIGILIIIISCLSFSNLQTTQLLENSKRMGIKQVNGATQFDLCLEMIIGRIYLLVFTIAMVLILIDGIFPFYQSLIGIKIDRNFLFELRIVSIVSFSIFAVSILFSMIQISRLEVHNSIKRNFATFNVPRLQRVITSFQFGIATALLLATSAIYLQVKHLTNMELGFNKDNIVIINSVFSEIPFNMPREEKIKQYEKQRSNYQLLIAQLESNPDILAFSQGSPPLNGSSFDMSWKQLKEGSEYSSQNTIVIDPQYDNLLGLEMVDGRFFSDSLDKSREDKVIINRAALRYWDIEDIHELKLANNSWGQDKKPFNIIGVVEDYHFQHLSKKVEPLVMLFMRDEEEDFMIQVRDGKENEVILFLDELYTEINPGAIFNYHWLDDELANQYENEKVLGNVYLFFTVIGLSLSIVSLFAFSFHETKRRTKEIGIRKINGASSSNILIKLGLGFLTPISIAVLVSVPVTSVMIHWWLDNFSTRIELGAGYYTATIFSLLVIIIITVGWQSWKVARSNPVKALRYE